MKTTVKKIVTTNMQFNLKTPMPITHEGKEWKTNGELLGLFLSAPNKQIIMENVGKELTRIYRKLHIVHARTKNPIIQKEKDMFNELIEVNDLGSNPPENKIKPTEHPPPPIVEEVVKELEKKSVHKKKTSRKLKKKNQK